MSLHDAAQTPPPTGEASRRTFLSLVSSAAMTSGLTAGYGTMAYMAGRFLYAGTTQELAWLYVAKADQIPVGAAIRFVTPAGHKVTLTRRSANGTAADFLALSSTCPHLGCQVHWEPQNNRFFCPCHNGAFDPAGQPTAGPPFEAKQALPQYPLKIENGLVFVQAPVEVVGKPAQA